MDSERIELMQKKLTVIATALLFIAACGGCQIDGDTAGTSEGTSYIEGSQSYQVTPYHRKAEAAYPMEQPKPWWLKPANKPSCNGCHDLPETELRLRVCGE